MGIRGWLARWVLSDPGTKVLAFVLAVCVWLAFGYFKNRRESFQGVPVRLVPPEGWSITSLSPRAVTVSVEGPAGTMESFLARQPALVFLLPTPDPEKLKGEPRQTVVLLSRHLNQPLGRLSAAFSPREVVAAFEESVTRVLPVEVVFKSSDLAPGFTLKAAQVRPDRVAVTGPRGAILAMQKIPTRPLVVSGERQDFAMEADLDLGPAVESKTRRVLVEFRVTEESKARTLTLKKNQISVLVPPDFPWRIEPYRDEVAVEVAGPASILDSLTPAALGVYIDRTDLPEKPEQRTYNLPLRIKHAGVDLKEETTVQVELKPRSP